MPGRYIYIRDNDSMDYWSASWQPVGKDLNNYKSKCCHGMGYTRMTAGYDGIRSRILQIYLILFVIAMIGKFCITA